MIQAYNFLYSWQLFPEKGTYEKGERPKSGTYKISSTESRNELNIEMNWVTLENQAFSFTYSLVADGTFQSLTEDQIAEKGKVIFIDSISLEIQFLLQNEQTLTVLHEIMPNGYLKVTENGQLEDGTNYKNISLYHKQMSVLPYSTSVSGAVIKPTEEGMIRHKSLTAMEEQTNMQLSQIRQQIELLALQAQEIQRRKDLSVLIYSAKLSFTPVIGQVYHLYEKKNGDHFLSLVSPKEWGNNGPFKKSVATVKLLADHTWMEVN
jgi:predicted transcriptional regulator